MIVVLAKSSVVVLLFAVGKIFLYDVAGADAMVRVLCFALTGAALYISLQIPNSEKRNSMNPSLI